MIRVHLADRGTATFSGSFQSAYQAAQAYIRDNSDPDPKKARITNVIQAADRPMLTQEVCDAAKVCRTSACRILNTMALLGEVRNVGPKFRAKWVKV